MWHLFLDLPYGARECFTPCSQLFHVFKDTFKVAVLKSTTATMQNDDWIIFHFPFSL